MYLTTVRLRLREFVLTDWQAAREYGADPETHRYKGTVAETEEDTRTRVRRTVNAQMHTPRRSYEFAIVLQANDTLIGRGNLNQIDGDTGEITVTLSRRFWGQGYGTEAAAGLLAFGFEHFHLHRILAATHPEHLASLRVLEKIGMRREALLRENKWVRGEWWDTLVWAVLEPEWRTQRQARR